MMRTFLSLVVILLTTMSAKAQDLSNVMQARLLPGWRAADGTHMSALHIELKPGWKTYWRAPGGSGIPPQFNWSRSRNMHGAQIYWPRPKLLRDKYSMSIGYDERVVFPIRILPKRTDRPIELRADLDIGVCKDVCVPVSLQLKQTLPADTNTRDPMIVAAMATRPFSAAEANVGSVTCKIKPSGSGLSIEARVQVPSQGGNEHLVIETDNPQLWIAQPKTQRSGSMVIAHTEVFHTEGGAVAINRSALRMTVLGQQSSVEIIGCSG